MSREKLLAERLKQIKSEIKKANLLAVTKYSPVEDIHLAYLAGQRDFGENRVDDLLEKAGYFESHGLNDVRWHFIGHLQSNKIKRLLKVPHLYAIHSIDSIKILESLHKRIELFSGEQLFYFLEVNTSGESEKSGLQGYEELAAAVNLSQKLEESPLTLKGLMTMGKIRTDDFEGDAMACFNQLNQFKEKLMDDFKLPELELSMGMSRDYHLAVKAGSNWVRVGSKIFTD